MIRDNYKSSGDLKDTLMLKLIADDKLCKCLNSSEPNFEDIEVKDKYSFLFDSIYPYQYIPNIQTETKSYITMSFKYRKSNNIIFKTGSITFYIFCHKDIVRTDYGLRYDYLLRRLDTVINDSKSSEFIGKMEYQGSEDFVVDKAGTYVGVIVRYADMEKT